MFFTGIITAMIACFIDISIESLAKYKYGFLKKWTDTCVEGLPVISEMFIIYKILNSVDQKRTSVCGSLTSCGLV